MNTRTALRITLVLSNKSRIYSPETGGLGHPDGELAEPLHVANHECLRLDDGFVGSGESFRIYPRVGETVSNFGEANMIKDAPLSDW